MVVAVAPPLYATPSTSRRCCCTLPTRALPLQRLGRGRVDITVGSALDIFGGALPYADVVAWSKRAEAEAPAGVQKLLFLEEAPPGAAAAGAAGAVAGPATA